MTPRELKRLDQALLEASQYLEYGAGHSTWRALLFDNITRIDSVESSRQFIDEELLVDEDVARNISSGRLQIHYVDIGETGAWGMPNDRSASERWPLYAEGVHDMGRDWDTVLVDGRFRVSCILNCVIRLPECTLLVHDFWNRNHYHKVLNFVDVLDSVDTLAVLRPRKDIDEPALHRLLEANRYATS